MPTECIMHALVLSAHAHNIEHYGLVKVVNNASGTRSAGIAIRRLECKAPSNRDVRYLV